MKRIYLSLLIIFATVISVMGIAYAYFSSTAVKMTGISLATGSPTIQISADGQSGWGESITGANENNMYPGWTGSSHNFYLKNTSTGMIMAAIIPTISLAGTPAANWDVLKGVVEARFTGTQGSQTSTDWKTLAYWQTNNTLSVPLPNDGMSPNAIFSAFSVQYRIPTGGDNSVAQGKSIADMEWSFVGRTQ